MRLLSNSGALPISLSLTLTLALPILAKPHPEGPDAGGLKIETTKAVTCTRKTQNGDTIYVNYRGTLQSDGSMFDSSEEREPFSFKLGAHEVIKGWDMGLLDMCLGEKRNLTIPPELAYGNRGVGKIPAGSTLIFETELYGIEGVGTVPQAAPTPSSREGELITATIGGEGAASTSFPLTDTAAEEKGSDKGPKDGDKDGASGECKLLGPFALLIQGALGILALLSLVYKRWRETPRRPLKVWSFDVSKQVVGSALLHLANLLMSMLSSGQFDITNKATAPTVLKDGKTDYPNPCSFYVLNVAIDTTIGIPILVGLLRILHVAFSRTALANPPESLKSGNYGHPPKATWWLKQSLIYFIGLVGMKLCVFFLFQLLPWLGWVGDWALRWTEGKAWMQITFVMLIFPLIMNALQYYIIDSFIKDSSSGGYEQAPDDEDDDEQEGLISGRRDSDDGSSEGAIVRNRTISPNARTKEANPTAVPIEYDESAEESSSLDANAKKK